MRWVSVVVFFPPECQTVPVKNTTTDVQRVGLNVDYNLGWLRQEENQYLSCPPQVAKNLPQDIQDLIGYRLSGTALGYFDGGLSPKKLFQETQPAIDWATPQEHTIAQASAWQQGKSKL